MAEEEVLYTAVLQLEEHAFAAINVTYLSTHVANHTRYEVAGHDKAGTVVKKTSRLRKTDCKGSAHDHRDATAPEGLFTAASKCCHILNG